MSGNNRDGEPLQVGIIGAGIAGLGAAIALLRAGHHVELYERSLFKNEVGAAITLSPNANSILREWGFDERKARDTVKEQFRYLDPITLEVIQHVTYDGIPNRFGGLKFNAYHRVDLHHQLREMAENAGAKVHLGKKATGLDCEQGIIQFADGLSVQKDLVVVADGFRSTFILPIVEEDISTYKMGASVYRTLIPIEKLMADPAVRPLYENQASGFMNTKYSEKGLVIITYPCRNDEVMNVAVFHQKPANEEAKEDWNSPASVDDIAALVDQAGCHPAWKSLVGHAEKASCYDLGIRDVVPKVNKGRAVLIGDAAHPMQPSYAQGACLSFEDCAALEVLFSASAFDKTKDTVAKRLQLFNQLRLPRNNVTQLLSNRMFYVMIFREDAEAMNQRIRTFWDGQILPPAADGWDKETQDFFFWYDTYKQTTKALQWKDDPTSMPRDAIVHFGIESAATA